MTAFFEGLGSLFEAFFTILPFLGNAPNIILLFVGFGAFFYWMRELKKFSKTSNE